MLTQLTAKSRRLLEAKNRGFLAGFTVLLVAAIFTLSLAGCGDGGGTTTPPVSEVDGTWTASGGRVVEFGGGVFTYKVGGAVQYTGSFEVSGSTITFSTDEGPAECTFALSGSGNGKTLTISDHTDPTVNGTYTVQAPPPPPGKGVDATISLAAVPGQANTFTLTLTGATWKADGDGRGEGDTTINYATRHWGYYIQSVIASSDSGILHWVNKEGVPRTLKVTVARTSGTVLTITVVKDTSASAATVAAGFDTGSGAITLWDNTHWAEEMKTSESRTWGAYFLFDWTNEGKRESDGNYSATYFGTLTVAEGSATSVSITIE
jgi:hypothetical protein